MVLQIVSGVLLALDYISDISRSFYSIRHLIVEVYFGWYLHDMHCNGSSFVFISCYFHIGRSLYISSYLWTSMLWMSGTILLIISMAIAFLGYVLAWGQMSFWGGTVITNLFSSVP